MPPNGKAPILPHGWDKTGSYRLPSVEAPFLHYYFETFKCAIKDTDTSAGNASANKVVCDIISFTDMSDPITVDLVSQKGFTIKNNGNDVDAKAVLYRNGEVLDDDGTAYTYTWKLWNSAGTSVIKTYTGKSITVSKADVTGKGVLMCEVSK